MKKRMIILLQIIIAIVLVGTSVYAAIDATLELKVPIKTVKRGDEVTVTLSLKNVDSNDKVKSVSGYINYDENVIEDITVDNIVKNEDGTVEIGNEILNVEDLTNKEVNQMPDTSAYVGFNSAPTTGNDARIVIDFNSGISEDTDLLTIKFKVKSNATIGEVKKAIEYEMFVITSSTNQQSQAISEDVTLTITSVDSGNDGNSDGGNSNDGNQTDDGQQKENKADNSTKNETGNTTNSVNNTTNNTVKNTTNKTTNSIAKNSNTADNTLASVGLPATGARAVVIPAIILILCAYICYNRYMKYKDI